MTHHRMDMNVVKSAQELQRTLFSLRCEKKSIGFVPTMGYLHRGHASLLEAARKKNDVLVASIFVNPRQFGPGEDLSRYPRDFDRDRLLCEKERVDYLFYPPAEEMYPADFGTSLLAPEALSNTLCGRSRPGHFNGVVTVVSKLFNIIMPSRAYFGEKDYQQLAIIRRMALDLNFPVEIIGMPIIREPDGLALSSRNSYLNPEERKAAAVLYKALIHAQTRVREGELVSSMIIREMAALILQEPLARIDYIQIIAPLTLRDVTEIEDRVVVALAAFIGKTRLIDNLLIEFSPKV